MISKGDRVQHNTFPPIVGTVQFIEPYPDNRYRVGVLNEETLTIYYDFMDTWEPFDFTSSTYDDVVDVEIVSVQ